MLTHPTQHLSLNCAKRREAKLQQPELRILLVEDQDKNIETWQFAVNAHNADATRLGFSIRTYYAKSLRQAEEALQCTKLDALIVDLRLEAQPGVGEKNDDGNALVKSVASSYPVSMIVVTGEKESADKENYPSQVQVHSRDEGLDPVFKWLAGEKDLLLHLRTMRESIERETAGIFFRSIWPRWKEWTRIPVDDVVASGLTRHVVAHVHDSLLHASGGATHPEEAYFVPPLKDWLDTGDLILEDSGEVWVVLTPRCDLGNADKGIATVVLARCSDISADWSKLEGGGAGKKKEMGQLEQHGRTPKQHFLPRMLDDKRKSRGPWMAQFHDLRVMPIGEAKETLPTKRLASLAPQFLPSLVERFGAYFSRIGSPNLSSD